MRKGVPRRHTLSVSRQPGFDLPSVRSPLRLLDEDELAVLVADDDVALLVAVAVAGHPLGADAGVVADQVRDELVLLAVRRVLEPVDDGGGVGLGVALGAVGPPALAGDNVLLSVAVHVV